MAALNGADKRVPLTAGTELDIPARIEISESYRFRLALDWAIVDAGTAAADQSAGLAFGSSELGAGKDFERCDATRQLLPLHRNGREFGSETADLEGGPCALRGCDRGLPAVTQRRRLGRQDLLGVVDFAVSELFEAHDLVNRQSGEEAQK